MLPNLAPTLPPDNVTTVRWSEVHRAQLRVLDGAPEIHASRLIQMGPDVPGSAKPLPTHRCVNRRRLPRGQPAPSLRCATCPLRHRHGGRRLRHDNLQANGVTHGLSPLPLLRGNCREAFTRYQEIFSGELIVMDGTQAPPDAGIPADKADLVMHASLTNGDELLMASDSYDDDFSPPAGMSVHYSTADLDRAKAIFSDLSEGGQVHMPGEEQFWTPFFGSVTDRFGTPWQISVEPPVEEA